MLSIKMDLHDPLVKEKLARLPENMLEWAMDVLKRQAQLIRALAQLYVPVDTGSLRDSIRVERGGSGLMWRQISVRAGGYVVNPDTGRLVDYAKFVHDGTRFMMGTFFIRQAVEEVRPQIREMIKARILEEANR